MMAVSPKKAAASNDLVGRRLRPPRARPEDPIERRTDAIILIRIVVPHRTFEGDRRDPQNA
jgi:hypothetical protein